MKCFILTRKKGLTFQLCQKGLSMLCQKPASVAQLDARLTGDQDVAGLIPARSATFFHGD